MYGKKFFVFVLVSMTLLIALGIWVIIDGTIAYQNRPMVEFYTLRDDIVSYVLPAIKGGIACNRYV